MRLANPLVFPDGSTQNAAAVFDLLSGLTANEVALGAAAMLTTGRMHVCTGTIPYAVTLPSASGNAGKLVGVRMGLGLTKLVTLAAASGDLIDGAASRGMWAGESAVLLCDGAAWAKIAGRSIPMIAKLTASGGAQNITDSSVVKLTLTVTEFNAGLLADAGNSRMVAARANRVRLTALASFDGFNVNANWPRVFARVRKNGTSAADYNSEASFLPGAFPRAVSTTIYDGAAGDFFEAFAFQNTGNLQKTYISAPLSSLLAEELVAW